MPVPAFDTCDLSRLEKATLAYLSAAKEFTKKFQRHGTKAKSSSKKGKPEKSSAAQLGLRLDGDHPEEEITAAQEHLRALHWRVDAEVLRLYALPPEQERELLDAFDDVRRVGVPFEQHRYIPREFRDVLTLDEFLRITDEWDATDTRRCELIEKRIKARRRTTEEEAEFRQLQRLLTLHRRYYLPKPMIDEKKLETMLKEDREWAARS